MTSASAATRRARNTKHFSKCLHLKRWQRSGSAATSSHTSLRGCVGRSLSEPSFEEREPDLLIVQGLLQKRQVLPDELLLQVDRVGGHDRAFVVSRRPAK